MVRKCSKCGEEDIVFWLTPEGRKCIYCMYNIKRKKKVKSKMKNNPEYIILHCSATKDSPTLSWDDIRRYHTKVKKWRTIGYHYGIEKIEDSYEILVGRFEEEVGAHCIGLNSKSIGICFMGNIDTEDIEKEQWEVGLKLVRSICNRYNIKYENVKGHREFADYKTCPGIRFDVEKFIKEL